MNGPTVSVVIPTYKRPDRLRRAVQSVARQTYDHIELVVVDDCSPVPARQSLSAVDTDGLDVCHVRHDRNRGANVARTTGIRTATGAYVAFLDDDDEWDEEKIEAQLSAVDNSDHDPGVVYTGSEFRHDGYTRVETPTYRGDVTRDILVGRRIGTFSTLLVARDAIEAVGVPDPAFPSWQDREWLLRLSTCTSFETVTRPLTIRWMDAETRIADRIEATRDVSYPQFLDKHRDLAASYGRLVERMFVASLSRTLGQAALTKGYYDDARRYLLKACYYYPFDRRTVLYALAALGGKHTYRPASRVVQWLHGLRTEMAV